MIVRPVVSWAPPRDEQLDGGESDGRPDEPRDDADGGALDQGQRQQVAPSGSPRPEQRQVAALALAGAEGGQIRDPERDQRAGDSQHDVERLGVERIPRRGVQRVGEVVDELHAARDRALDAKQRLAGERERRGRAARLERGAVELRLHLPLDALLSAGLGVGQRAGGRDRRQLPTERSLERPELHDHRVLGRLRGGGANRGVERLEDLIGGGDKADARDLVGLGLRAGLRNELDGVADLGLEGRGHLLVEDDAARLQRAVEQAEGVDVVRVVRGDGEDGAVGCGRAAGRACVGRGCERGGRRRRGLCHARLLGHCLSRALRLRRRGDGTLPVERNLAHGRRRGASQGVPDEEEHRREQRDRRGDHDDPQHGPTRSSNEAREGEASVHCGHAPVSSTTRPSASSIVRLARAATSASCVAMASANPSSSRSASIRSRTRSPVSESR